MYFGDPRRRGLPTVRFGGAAIESAAVKTLTETKRNLFRLSFTPDLANCGRLTKIDSTRKAAIFNYAKCFIFWITRRNASRVTMGL